MKHKLILIIMLAFSCVASSQITTYEIESFGAGHKVIPTKLQASSGTIVINLSDQTIGIFHEGTRIGIKLKAFWTENNAEIFEGVDNIGDYCSVVIFDNVITWRYNDMIILFIVKNI